MKEKAEKQEATSPCAACKLLRRLCAQDCVFAPYFPADEPHKFAKVHKVFGASNVNKMLQELPEHQRSDAVSSMAYEANARLQDPVYGCAGAISSLLQQIDALKAQLALSQAEVIHMRMRQVTNQSSLPATSSSFTGGSWVENGGSPPSRLMSSHHKRLFALDMLEEQAQTEESLWSSSRTRAPPAPVIRHMDPPPTPRPLAQFLAIGLILFSAFLQFLPATHFRDPSDPLRSWIPYKSSSSSSSSPPNWEISRVASAGGREVGAIHVVSWVDCLDLRMLAVLANSTLSNSRYPEHIHFHFFTPEGNADKVSYYKLKVLFPHSNLEILGQEEVKQKFAAAASIGEYTMPSIHELAPFIIPITHPSLRRFIYVSPDIILKGSIEELFETDLGSYGIAATEDCRKHLSDYVSLDVLDAIRRVSAEPWVSMKPYERTACAPNLDVLLISTSKLEKDILEAILRRCKLLNSQHQRNDQISPAVAGALYGKYLKLPTTWIASDSTPQKLNDGGMKVLRSDGPRSLCSPEHDNHEIHHLNFGNLWEQYLPSVSSRILVN